MAENRSKSDQYLLRLPPGLREALKKDADVHARSLNAEIIERLEKYPRLVTGPMEVSYLKMENDRLAQELDEARQESEKNRVLAAQLQHLLDEGFRKAAQEQETANIIEEKYLQLKEQSDFLKQVKADILALSQDRLALDEEKDQLITSQSEVIEGLKSATKTARLVLSRILKAIEAAAAGDPSDLNKMIEETRNSRGTGKAEKGEVDVGPEA